MAAQRACRVRQAPNRRLLVFSASLVSCCALERGRARSWALDAGCRWVAAYTLACGLRLHARHVATDRNRADRGSRKPEELRKAWRAWRRARGLPAPLPVFERLPLRLDDLAPAGGAASPWQAAKGWWRTRLRMWAGPAGQPPQAPAPAKREATLDRPLPGPAAEPVALELFSGSGRLRRALANAGPRMGPAVELAADQ